MAYRRVSHKGAVPVNGASQRRNAERRLTLTVPEAGQQLGISRNAAYEAAKRGEIPVVKIGRRLLVPTVALERLLQEAGLRTA